MPDRKSVRPHLLVAALTVVVVIVAVVGAIVAGGNGHDTKAATPAVSSTAGPRLGSGSVNGNAPLSANPADNNSTLAPASTESAGSTPSASSGPSAPSATAGSSSGSPSQAPPAPGDSQNPPADPADQVAAPYRPPVTIYPLLGAAPTLPPLPMPTTTKSAPVVVKAVCHDGKVQAGPSARLCYLHGGVRYYQ
jgi:hypothetical protein